MHDEFCRLLQQAHDLWIYKFTKRLIFFRNEIHLLFDAFITNVEQNETIKIETPIKLVKKLMSVICMC